MLSVEENDRLTQVGPGTPMGKLMRRYWHPVATSQDIKGSPVRTVRILGESLTLFRDRQGRLGLISQRCAHRGVDLRHGIPESEGLRCPYHGWMYDTTGQCVEMPAESPESTFAARVKLTSYPVEELAGLVWGYLGPEPPPLLPRWDFLVWDNAFRTIGTTVMHANCLQCQENSIDPVHSEWLHGHFGLHVLDRLGIDDAPVVELFNRFLPHHLWVDFDRFEYGFMNKRLREGQPDDAGSARVGIPMLFPNIGFIGGPSGRREAHIRVPLDDTHTWHVTCTAYFAAPGMEVPIRQDPVPAFEAPIVELPTFAQGHSMQMYESQRAINDRSVEVLSPMADRGLIMFRRLLGEQINVVEDGGDPMNTFRDPAKNQRIDLPFGETGGPPLRRHRPGFSHYGSGASSTDPAMKQLDEFLTRCAEAHSKAEARSQH